MSKTFNDWLTRAVTHVYETSPLIKLVSLPDSDISIPQDTVAEIYPEAFEALPEPYQNDHCLNFFVYDGKLHCEPDDAVVGDWESVYDPTTKKWSR